MRTLVNGAGRSRVSAVSSAPWSAQNYVSAFTTAAARRARSSAPGQVARRRIDRCDGSAWTVGRRRLMVAVGPPPDRRRTGPGHRRGARPQHRRQRSVRPSQVITLQRSSRSGAAHLPGIDRRRDRVFSLESSGADHPSGWGRRAIWPDQGQVSRPAIKAPARPPLERRRAPAPAFDSSK